MYQNIYISRYDGVNPSMVYIWDDEHGIITVPYSKFRYGFTPSSHGMVKSLYGHRVRKINRWTESDLIFESDVSRETRVLIDLYLDSDEPSTGHVVGVFDIEVDIENGFPDVERADSKITAIAFYNKETKLYNVFVLDEENRIEDRTKNNVSMHRFDTEHELLSRFLIWYESQKFTILTNWNGDTFDIPYLYRRLKNVLGEDNANRLSPIGIVQWSDFKKRYKIAGISCLDYLNMYKKFTYKELPNYRLGTVGEKEVGIAKLEYEGSLDTLYKEDIDKYIEYNLNDVVIIVKLDEKMDLIELVRGICHKGHVPYEDYTYSSKFIDGTILTYLRRRNIVSPNKPVKGREEYEAKKSSGEKGFEGAFVKEPIPGRYDWVYSLDLQSLYPSIIMSLNISPETKYAKVVDTYSPDKLISKSSDKIAIYEESGNNLVMTYAELSDYIDKNNLSISASGVMYDLSKEGAIPQILKTWFAERLEFQQLRADALSKGDEKLAEYYDRRQHIQKIFLNCFSPDTEVITVDGIRNIIDLSVGDMVYSINPNTMEVEEKPVTRVYEYDYEGDMVNINTNHIDFSITPNHRMLTSVDGGNSYTWELAEDVIAGPIRTLPPIDNSDNNFNPTDDVSTSRYNGKVHCVEVADNHTLLAGRNGKYNWIGQSIYGVLGLPIFRFYDIDNALSVTLTGQKVIEFSNKYVTNLYNKFSPYSKVEIETDTETIELAPAHVVTVSREGNELSVFAMDLEPDDEILNLNFTYES